MLRALRHRDFRLLWTGQAVSLVGDRIYLVASAWLVYDRTGPVAELLGARTTLALSGVLGSLTLVFLFVPGVRDPEREPLAGDSL